MGDMMPDCLTWWLRSPICIELTRSTCLLLTPIGELASRVIAAMLAPRFVYLLPSNGLGRLTNRFLRKRGESCSPCVETDT